MKMSEVRAKFPMYSDMSDDQLLIGIRQKFYSDIPMGEFSKRIEYDTNKPNPTEGMSTFDRAASGIGKAVVDTGRGIKGLFVDNKAEVEESRRLDAPLMDTGAGMAGNVAGHIGMALAPGGALKVIGKGAEVIGATKAANALSAAGTSVMAPTTIKGAATLGGAIGASQPALDWEERGKNALIGATASGAGTAVLKGASRVVSPKTAPNVRALMDEGITPTAGQILGGGFKRAEEGLTSVPILGDAIKKGQTRAVGQMNTAAFNRALDPIGEKLPAGLHGREAVEYTGEALGKRYDALLPKLTVKADQPFMQDVQTLRGMVGNGSIAPAEAKQFDAILQNQVLGKFKGQGALTGQTMKDIESDLGRLSSKFLRDPSADKQLLGDALQELQSNLRNMVARNNPAHAVELKKINTGWANYKRVERAAAGLGAEDGIFSAAQLQNAVKALDKSKDKNQFAKGNALMQDLSESAKGVLGPKVPDSGTPYRLLTSAGLPLLGAGGVATGNFDPTTGAAIAAAPLLFSRPGQNALAAILARRPDAAAPVGNALQQLAPYAAVPAAGYTTR